jgi:hypothetical protein
MAKSKSETSPSTTTTPAPAPTMPDAGEILEVTCPGCQGAGRKTDASWTRWREELARAQDEGKPPPRPPFQLEWTPCPECSGHGLVPTGAGGQLLDFIRRHLNLIPPPQPDPARIN